MTDTSLALIAGLLVGFAAGWLTQLPRCRLLLQAAAEARTEAREATNRLLASWAKGDTIAPPPTEPVPPPAPLPAVLQEVVEEWEDGQHRAEIEAEFRARLMRGEGVVAILAAYEDNHR
jgi:hypothetical protein